MLNSLTLESRKLIEQLSLKKRPVLQNLQNDKSTNVNDLLFNSDNFRKKKTESMVNKYDISESYPKSSVTSILSRSAVLSKSADFTSNVSSLTICQNEIPKRIPFGLPNTLNDINEHYDLNILKNSDLLGYDWIVAMMENRSNESQLDKPLEYFDELDRFRRRNKQFCMSTENKETNGILTSKDFRKNENSCNYHVEPPSDEIHNVEEPPHVYAYTLNERLFPVPLDLETAERGKSTVQNPHIIKVSIPSNRFYHRTQRLHSTKEHKSSIIQTREFLKNLGESLSLSSHCHESAKNTSSEKLKKKNILSRQKPASLIGNLLPQTLDFSDSKYEILVPLAKYQPKTEKEAIEQLKRGNTISKLHRIIPSSLENRTFNIDSTEMPSNISQTRIALKDIIDDSIPRKLDNCSSKDSKPRLISEICHDISGNIPRPSVSRNEMSKLYVDAIQNVMSS